MGAAIGAIGVGLLSLGLICVAGGLFIEVTLFGVRDHLCDPNDARFDQVGCDNAGSLGGTPIVIIVVGLASGTIGAVAIIIRSREKTALREAREREARDASRAPPPGPHFASPVFPLPPPPPVPPTARRAPPPPRSRPPLRPKFCARCGAALKGPFCSQCRFKNW